MKNRILYDIMKKANTYLFQFGSYHFPAFNVADSFVVVGTIMMAYYLLFIHKDKEETNSKKPVEEKAMEQGEN